MVGRREYVLQQAAAQLSGCRYAVANVSKAEDRERLARDFADVNVLINNAAIQYTKPLAEQTDAEICIGNWHQSDRACVTHASIYARVASQAERGSG